MRYSKLILSIFLFCYCSSGSIAQLRFDRIGNQQGLSQSTVLKAFQDKKGFIWFATRDGLNKYDGYGFTVYRHIFNDPNSISSGNVTCMTEDVEGNLWIGTSDGGVNKLDHNSGKFVHFKQTNDGKDISELNVSSIVSTKDNKVWVATYEYGLVEFDNTKQTIKWRLIETRPISTNEISQLYQDRLGNLMLGGAFGVITQIDNKNKTHSFKIENSFNPKKNQISCFFENTRGDILIGTRGNGLYKIDLHTRKITQLLYNPTQIDRDNLIMSLAYDQDGTLWVGTDSGVILIKNDDFKNPIHLQSNPDSETGLSSHAIQGILVDRENNVWIGTWEAGLNVHYSNSNKFRLFRHRANSTEGLLRDKVTSIVCEDNNKVWIGSNSGLTLLDRRVNTFKYFIKDPTNSAISNYNDINFLFKDKDKDIIVLTWGGGMRILQKGTNQFVNYNYEKSGFSPYLTCIGDSKIPNKLWIGMQEEGLLLFDKITGKFSPIIDLNIKEILAHIHVNSVLEDSNGILWIGSYNTGIYNYDPKTGKINHFQQSEKEGSIKGNHVFQIIEDSKKRIWVATNGGGFCLFQPQKNNYKTWTMLDGLPNNTVKGILEDNQHTLWLATNQGLANFNIEKNTFKNYSQADGLQGSEFLINAYTKNDAGEMFFGGTGGMNVFYPDSLRENPKVPKVYITGLRLFNKPVSIGQKDSPLQNDIISTKTLEFKASQNVFSIEYTALDFQKFKNNQYAYMLEGFDEDWNYVGTQRIASYTNLSAGEYTFKVKASNNDGIWNPQETTIKIIILPPLYKSWWAFLIYGCLILGSIYALRRVIQVREGFKSDIRLQEIEKQQIQELDRLKTNFFTNISHEFRTPLTLIISPLEKYLSDNIDISEASRKRTESVYRNAKQLQKLINQLLDLSKLEAGRLTPEITQSDLAEFTENITNSFQDLAEQKKITLKYCASETQLMAYFDGDIVEKIVTNLLSNAFKFSKEGGEISVILSTKPFDNENVILKVSDTGIGISPEHLPNIFNRFYQVHDSHQPQLVGTGVGLSLCKELAEIHRGEILVNSKIGEGTTFSLYLPIAKKAYDIQWIRETLIPHETSAIPLVNLVQNTENQEFKELNLDSSILLIAEDNEDLRNYIKEIFMDKFQILEAENGQEALKLAQENIPDLIISDWMMPIMTGVELCESVKTNPKISHIPIIILTSKSSNESKQIGLETGADDYITKPFNANLLEVRVKNILENRKKLRELFGKSAQVKYKEIALNSSDEHFLIRVVKIVEQNLDNLNLDISFLEDELKMSNMQLYRKLKSLTNLSGNEFIKNVRLKKAVQLLESENFSVSEIAYKVGFNDPSYFTRMFKKEFGKTPSEYLERSLEV
jgi:signal transduction histidine kinase/ligand-binding sensor domain-containing protein/DNA-binding response OmpR family regulator